MTALVVEKALVAFNITRVRELAPGKQIIAVLASNAHGIGLVPMAGLAAQSGITSFAVTDPADALVLRRAKFNTEDILILRSTTLTSDIAAIAAAHATATVGSLAAANAYEAVAARLEKPLSRSGTKMRVHVEIDTGMGRYGFLPEQIDQVVSVYQSMPHLKVTGIYTHYARAFDQSTTTSEQASAFKGVVDALRARGIDPGLVHASNSAAVFCHPELDHLDAVRIGSALTGRVTGATATGLKRVGSLRAPVVEVRQLPAGHPIGYGAVYTTKRPTRIAVLPVGYADGFMVEKSRDVYRFIDLLRYVLNDIKTWRTGGVTYVLVDGQKARVLGHVGLNHTIIDVTGIPCEPGDMVTLPASPLLVPRGIEREYI